MERGTTHINNGAGAISTLQSPQPVFFAPASFPKIVDGEDVYFQRVASNPQWAANVVPAPQVDQLVLMATPPAGLTRSAEAKVLETAARFVEEAQAAPTDAHARAHIKFAKNIMISVSRRGEQIARPVGIQSVRDALKPS